MADALLGTEQIRRVVRQLSFFARKDADDSAPVPLEQALDAAIQMAMTEIRHRARLVRDYAPTPRVVGEQAMSQVFLNVLVNAAQAIPLGAVDRNEIRVTTRTTPQGWASVDVSDSGEGIDPRNLARIFDPFFTTKPQGRGTGLGLSICRDLVKSKGGTIAVMNRAGSGATVRIELPPAPQRAPDAVPSPAEAPVGPALARTRILVVDDERRLLSVLAMTLGERHEVVVTDDVYGALTTALGEKRFDYILCDLMMPALTGMDFYAAVKAADAALAERIIFMTGGAFTPRAREFLERVKNPRIEKPFIASDVEELIRRSYAPGVANAP
jgi:CheY-like chemotaxis protein